MRVRSVRSPSMSVLLMVIVASLSFVALAAGPATRPGDALKFAPDPGKPDPAVLDGLTRDAWLSAGVRDILGRGTDTSLKFERVADRIGLKVTRTTIRYARYSDPPTEKTETFDGCVDRPVVAFGDERTTFAFTPGRELVLRAVVPVGGHRWYFADVLHYGNAPDRTVERVFDFGADPLRAATGKVAVTLREGDGVARRDARFTATADRQGRQLSITWQGVNLARMTIDPGGKWASLDEPRERPAVFTPRIAANR